MKVIIAILIIAAFLQSTILPIDLVLLVLIPRAYIKPDRTNLYLAFIFGLFISHLDLTKFGLQSLIYLIIIQATQVLSRLRLAGNPLLIIPVTLVFLLLDQVVNILLTHQMWDFPGILFASFLSLPILYMLKIWEERFIAQKEIKLKM